MLGIPIILVIAAGIAWAGSQNGFTVLGIPIFALCVAAAFIIQWIAFIPAFIWQTEKFYDLVGSLTFLSVIWMAAWLSPVVDSRTWLLLLMISIWAIRLGTFLFSRVQTAGEDRRFHNIKPSFTRFLIAWTLQALWVSFTLAAALAAITSISRKEFGIYALMGILVWIFGFAIEVIADQQKSKFRSNPENAGKFINIGLWSWSRHPNYFGEIVLWIGVSIVAMPVLSGWQWLTLASPVFVAILLIRISGIPMLEAIADEKWGGQAEYENYKAKTSLVIPIYPPAKK